MGKITANDAIKNQNMTATTAMARTIIATAREDAVVILCDAILALRNVTAPTDTDAKDTMLRAIGSLVHAMNEAESEVVGF